jgi:multiple sugar transport system substrate-binding protein
MKRLTFVLLSFLVVASLLLAACGATAEPTKAPEPTEAPKAEATKAPEPTEAPKEEEAGEKVQVRWFVGLGTGANPDQIPQEDEVVARFNETHDNIELVVEYVTNEQAPDQLKTQIAAGNAPDIIGPVGQSGVNEFEGSFMDLTEYIESTGYDLGVYDPGSVDFYRVADGMYGIPFAVFPSFIYYNRDLFDEAGLEYPPHQYGEPYADGDPWTVEKLEEIAMLLTVDVNGNDATMDGFDPDNIAQFGYVTQWNNNDIRSQCAALFGADTLVDDDGNAVISDRWRDCVQWYYAGMHEKHFMPDLTYDQSDLLGAGNPFDSGNVAMAHSHLWYICCNNSVENWDIAAVPAWNDEGDVTSKLHADTFRIFDSTEHPDEAFYVLAWLTNEGSADLTQIYGALPARLDQQDAFFEGLDERFPQGVDWQVVVDSLPYPDVPGHEWNMPNYSQAVDRLQAFGTLYAAEAGLDLDAEIDQLIADLQVIFDQAE